MADALLEPLLPGVWRLPLPSRTMPPFDHTNHFIVADGGVGALVEAGFQPEELGRLRAALGASGVRLLKAVLLTHTHPDHVAGLGALLGAFPGTPVYLHPNELERLEHPGLQALQDERVLTVGNHALRALHTPGHSPGHLSFLLGGGLLLAGDLVAGQGSSWVGHPEGDVNLYLKSLERLAGHDLALIAPGHGEVSREPQAKLAEARAHRLARLEQVYAQLAESPRTLAELRAAVYPSAAGRMRELSEMSLLALLKKLMSDLRVLHLGEDERGPYAQRR